jgi:hypothetical protein
VEVLQAVGVVGLFSTIVLFLEGKKELTRKDL